MSILKDKSKFEELVMSQAWSYFQLHSNQRLTTFNFYLIIVSLLASSLFITFQKDYQNNYLGIPIGLLIIFLSFIFWKIDERNRSLIKLAEDALKYFEQQYPFEDNADGTHKTKIFTLEEQQSQNLRKYKILFSYAECFRVIFVSVGILGFIGAVASFLNK